MTNRIFISYTTKDQWVIPRLEDLIRAVLPDAEIFCSATGSIPPGENWNREIFENLERADVFAAILSYEYWKSKFCIVELGAAYERYCFDHGKPIDIQPLLLPPLDKGMALANTPLMEIQVTNLADTADLTAFLKRLAGPDGAARISAQRAAILEYVTFLKAQILTGTSLTDKAVVNAYYDEPAGNPIPKDSIVLARRLEHDAFRFEFRLSSLTYTPSFASMAFEYFDEVNLQEYLRFDRDAAFSFRLDNDAGVLTYIDVEFKTGPNHEVFQRIRKELAPGENQVSVSLAEMNYKPLTGINQICFVVHPKDMKKQDGAIVIDQIHVAFEQKNILAVRSV